MQRMIKKANMHNMLCCLHQLKCRRVLYVLLQYGCHYIFFLEQNDGVNITVNSIQNPSVKYKNNDGKWCAVPNQRSFNMKITPYHPNHVYVLPSIELEIKKRKRLKKIIIKNNGIKWKVDKTMAKKYT